jgi:hypothetical protein
LQRLSISLFKKTDMSSINSKEIEMATLDNSANEQPFSNAMAGGIKTGVLDTLKTVSTVIHAVGRDDAAQNRIADTFENLSSLITNPAVRGAVSDSLKHEANKIETAYREGDTSQLLTMAGALAGTLASPQGAAAKATHEANTLVKVAHDVNLAIPSEQLLHGEHIAANQTAKAVTIQQSATELAIPKLTVTQTLLKSAPIQIFKDVFNPPVDTKIALEAYKRQPG